VGLIVFRLKGKGVIRLVLLVGEGIADHRPPASGQARRPTYIRGGVGGAGRRPPHQGAPHPRAGEQPTGRNGWRRAEGGRGGGRVGGDTTEGGKERDQIYN